MRCALLLAAAFLLASPVRAEVKDGTWMAGVGAGMGSGGKGLGAPYVVGGQLLYHPTGAWGYGVQADRFDFKAKAGNKADMTGVLGVVRGNVNMSIGTSEMFPYLLFGMGYAMSRADIAAGGDSKGSGFAWCLGGGVEYPVGAGFSVGGELKMERLGSGIPRLGMTGVTAIAALLRLNHWFGQSEDPFAR